MANPETCAMCEQPILPKDSRANSNLAMHTECAVRAALGGIGHLLDHAHFCGPNGDPDAGLDWRTSAKMVMVWVEAHQTDGLAAVLPDA